MAKNGKGISHMYSYNSSSICAFSLLLLEVSYETTKPKRFPNVVIAMQ